LPVGRKYGDVLETLQTSDRAVTPVVGKAVIVGVTVLLAATATVYFTGIADEVTASPPAAAFESTQYGNSLTVTHATGDRIDAAQLYVRHGGTEEPWSAVGSTGGGDVSSGDAATFSVSGETTVRVVWREGDQSAVLFREAVSAPTTATFSGTNSGVNASGVDGQYAGFGNKHIETRGGTPEGHFRAGSPGAELRDTSDTVQSSASFTPTSGTRYPFTLEYDGSQFEFSIDGTTVSTGALSFDDDAVAVQAKVADAKVDKIAVGDLRLDGAPVGTPSSFEVTSQTEKSLVVEDASMGDGFVLTGTVTYEFDPSLDIDANGEAAVLRVDVA
jgi:FlaG/FlaF family flagellin (archaellin)